MDTALLKFMPDLGSLKQPTYRMPRKKLQIFEKPCQARGQLVVTEAALMMLNSLEGDSWLEMEDVSLDQFDTMNGFDEFYECLIVTVSTILSKSCRHAWKSLSLDSIASVPNHCVNMFVDLMLWSSSCAS